MKEHSTYNLVFATLESVLTIFLLMWIFSCGNIREKGIKHYVEKAWYGEEIKGGK